jgi:hypothetical protein
MLVNLLIGLATMVACLNMQALLVAVAVRFYARRKASVVGGSFGAIMVLLCGVMLLLVLGNALQIAIWAGVFMVLEEFNTFSVAVYHSAVNFATLGYGDIVMSEQHRLLGPLEAVNGVLMIGVSTAVVMWALQDAMQGAIAGHK